MIPRTEYFENVFQILGHSEMILSITTMFFKSFLRTPEYLDDVSPIYYPIGANIF